MHTPFHHFILFFPFFLSPNYLVYLQVRLYLSYILDLLFFLSSTSLFFFFLLFLLCLQESVPTLQTWQIVVMS